MSDTDRREDPVYTLSNAVRDRLALMKKPATVTYGNAQYDESPDAPLVEFKRDRSAGDVFEAPVTTNVRRVDGEVYKARAKATIGVLVELSLTSTRSGAAEHDHTGELWQLAQDVWCAILVCAHAAKLPLSSQARGSFVAIESGAPLEIGARYELTFGLEAAVEELTGYVAPAPLNGVITTKAKREATEEISSGPGP